MEKCNNKVSPIDSKCCHKSGIKQAWIIDVNDLEIVNGNIIGLKKHDIKVPIYISGVKQNTIKK